MSCRRRSCTSAALPRAKYLVVAPIFVTHDDPAARTVILEPGLPIQDMQPGGVVARRVMVGSGSAAGRARGARGVVGGGELEVDQRGVHDTGNPPTRGQRISGGWQASRRYPARVARCGSRPPTGGCPHLITSLK